MARPLQLVVWCQHARFSQLAGLSNMFRKMRSNSFACIGAPFLLIVCSPQQARTSSRRIAAVSLSERNETGEGPSHVSWGMQRLLKVRMGGLNIGEDHVYVIDRHEV